MTSREIDILSVLDDAIEQKTGYLDMLTHTRYWGWRGELATVWRKYDDSPTSACL